MFFSKNFNTPQTLSHIIEKGIVILLVATPLAFGSVGIYASSFMELGVFIIFGAWFIKGIVEGEFLLETSWALYLLCALIVLTVLQLLPLPQGVLSVISPNRVEVEEMFLNDSVDLWSSISVYRYATVVELKKLLAYSALFVVITSHYRKKEQVMVLIKTVLCVGVFLAVFAVVQKMTWNGSLYWFYPIPRGINSDATHIWGPYLNHSHFAGYMEMAIMLALGLLLYRSANLKLLPGLSFKRVIVRLADSGKLTTLVVPAIAALIMSAVLFLSLSRGGIAGLTGAVFIFILMAFSRKSLKKKTALTAVFTVFVLALILFSSWGRIEQRFLEVGEPGKVKRFELWVNIVDVVKDYPVVGTGLGTFKNIYPIYQDDNSTSFFAYAENEYIEVLTDFGIVGLLMVVIMAGFYLRSVILRWRMRRDSFVKCLGVGTLAAIAAILIHSFSDFNLRIPSNALLFVVVLALSHAIIFNVSSRKGRGRRDEVRTKR